MILSASIDSSEPVMVEGFLYVELVGKIPTDRINNQLDIPYFVDITVTNSYKLLSLGGPGSRYSHHPSRAVGIGLDWFSDK